MASASVDPCSRHARPRPSTLDGEYHELDQELAHHELEGTRRSEPPLELARHEVEGTLRSDLLLEIAQHGLEGTLRSDPPLERAYHEREGTRRMTLHGNSHIMSLKTHSAVTLL
jgi:hypothetical protein